MLKSESMNAVSTDRLPLRTCIACGDKDQKKRLVRLVMQDNIVSIDPLQRQQVRGCYICKKSSCLDSVKNSKLLNRAFRTRVISKENLTDLINDLKRIDGVVAG